ncbi:Sur2 hydroxylase/desaturase [Striga asiatica]|uniref:Sur2 hydroxylase/desaturase n=1 Tax=Striga asiatica TaxID=4170 RepID=A0A5A7QHP3_STRAF|nr:Sur2 hydroxylase/desaturase [Striga asiatica]
MEGFLRLMALLEFLRVAGLAHYYRPHTKKDEDDKNLVYKRGVTKGLLIQQKIEAEAQTWLDLVTNIEIAANYHTALKLYIIGEIISSKKTPKPESRKNEIPSTTSLKDERNPTTGTSTSAAKKPLNFEIDTQEASDISPLKKNLPIYLLLAFVLQYLPVGPPDHARGPLARFEILARTGDDSIRPRLHGEGVRLNVAAGAGAPIGLQPYSVVHRWVYKNRSNFNDCADRK